MISQLPHEVVSNETKRSWLPRIDNPVTEGEKIKKEESEMFDLDKISDEGDMENIQDKAVEVAEDVASKSLNGAQTQSLINIIEQYSQQVISLGQAVNLISVSIGISKEDAKKIIEGTE